MPKLIIDNRHIEVPSGTRVIDAAEKLGIMIPRFCYLKTLGAVGACRMCAVVFEDGPVHGLQMSCMVTAADGMRVSTTHPEAMEFRRWIIECLMLNHPHDCPVCDEGGHCLLQDETISGGHGQRRYTGKKRTYQDQNLGPLVAHEMNRCIHCYRCVRFYQEYAGYRDLGAMGIASRVYFGRLAGGVLENPFAGNLIDLCPTGVYTDKPSRHSARRWDLQRAPSVCLHCSLGCNTMASAHYHAVIRQESREDSKANGSFICDRGRYGFAYANLPDRPRQALLDGVAADWREAMKEAAGRFKRVTDAGGHSAAAVLGSARSSLEALIMLRYLSHHTQWRPPIFFVDDTDAHVSSTAVNRLDSRLAAGLYEIEQADFLLAIGVDPVQESPMLALAMRQAARNGAAVVVLDPRPVALPFDFDLLPTGIADLTPAFALLVKTAFEQPEIDRIAPRAKAFFDALPQIVPDGLREKLLKAGELLRAGKRPAIICGTALSVPGLTELAADLTLLLHGIKAGSRLFYTLPGANAFAAGMLQSASRPFSSLLRDIEDGAIRALLVVENDLFFRYPDHERLGNALKKLDLLVVVDYLPSSLGQTAQIFLPTSTVFEAGGSFINSSGLLQFAEAVHEGGVPLNQRLAEMHPSHSSTNPPDSAKLPSAYEALLALAGELGIRTPTADASPWSLLPDDYSDQMELFGHTYPKNGLQLLPQVSSAVFFQDPPAPDAAKIPGEALAILLVEQTFGSEELSCHAEPLRQLIGPPQAFLHPGDAVKIGMNDKDRLHFEFADRKITLQLRVKNTMAPGHLIIPWHYTLQNQEMPWPDSISYTELKKMQNQDSP